jgi:hypothetical protein
MAGRIRRREFNREWTRIDANFGTKMTTGKHPDQSTTPMLHYSLAFYSRPFAVEFPLVQSLRPFAVVVLLRSVVGSTSSRWRILFP